MKEKINRSPLFYVGDKYKLIEEIKTYFPKNINQFIEPFVGGGSVFLNVDANSYLLNDIDTNVISIHKYLSSYIGRENEFFDLVFKTIDKYNLSCSYHKDIIPIELRQKYKKTFFAKFNKENYSKLKSDYNKSKDVLKLYILLIYGFNRMLRFNKSGEFNLPVGNVDFNKNVFNALDSYFKLNSAKKTHLFNQDFNDFLSNIDYQKNDLIYLDPPYLITFSEYNKLWNKESESKLLVLLDKLNKKNINFAISNVTHYKDKENADFIAWSKKYKINNISSNYISYHDNTIKSFKEVLVCNY